MRAISDKELSDLFSKDLLRDRENNCKMEFINKITASSVFSSSKCFSCCHGLVVAGKGKEVAYCTWVNKPMNFVVECCSEYKDKTLPSLRDMEDIAYVLKTDEKTRKIGFVPLIKEREKEDQCPPFSGEGK